MFRSLTGSAAALGPAAPAVVAPRRAALYRAVWRWHFFAGLVCLPFLVLLSATGALYLFKDEINASVFAYRTIVSPGPVRLGPDRLIFNATQAVPDGLPLTYTETRDAHASALVTLKEGEARILVYLDPYTGSVLDRVPADAEFLGVVRRLHSLSYFGPVANGLIEVVAGFAVILVVTGAYLWWPESHRTGQPGGQRGGVVTVRGSPARRVWWRDLHAVTGLAVGGGLLFLALTGLPWSIVWGQQLRAWSNAAGLGQPRILWAEPTVSPLPLAETPLSETLPEIGWTLRDAATPRSAPREARPIGPDRAVAILREMGMPGGFELALPADPAGVYAAAVYPKDVTGQRLISLDQYTGRPLVDVPFRDLGSVGRAIQYGIGIHKGEHFGRLNQGLMLAFCLGTILLCVTAATMWWKRRPPGRLGAPPRPRDPRAAAGVAAIVLGLGVLFPLTGLAILAMLGLDRAGQALFRPSERGDSGRPGA